MSNKEISLKSLKDDIDYGVADGQFEDAEETDPANTNILRLVLNSVVLNKKGFILLVRKWCFI